MQQVLSIFRMVLENLLDLIRLAKSRKKEQENRLHLTSW